MPNITLPDGSVRQFPQPGTVAGGAAGLGPGRAKGGPAGRETGFSYAFAYKRPFTPEDLVAIEKKMSELAKKDYPVTREELPRDQAVALFKGMGEHYKAEIIASIAEDQAIGLYREGDFVDLCRAPHVPSTGKLKV